MRLIDAEALARTMYHKAFEIDDGRSRWDSGLWIRYKIFEEALEEQKTVEAEPVCLCKECLRFERNHWETVNGIPLIVGHNICNGWVGGCQTDPEGYCFMAERKEK